MPAWTMRLIAPLLFGLAAAFALTGAWQLRAQDHTARIPPDQIVAQTPVSHSWAGTILEKNILDLEVPDPTELAPGPRQEDDPASWAHLGTLTGRMPKVLLRDNGQLLILNQGEIFKGWELAEVHPHSVVWLSAESRREVRMWTTPPDVDPAAAASAAPLQPWTEPATGTKISLSRRDVQPLLSDPNALLQMANFKPFTVDGKVSGFQVLSIRPDSLLHKVGLRNGDVLARINGQALTGPTQLLQAYSGMDRASLVTLDVQRASQMLTYLVEIN